MKAKLLVLVLLFCAPLLLSQQPQFGGIISNHPFLQGQALGVELTWLGLRNAGSATSIVVKYQYICDNGIGAASPASLKQGAFVASDGQTTSAAFGFSGTATPFPCNGWLVNASMLIAAPATITPGELSAQLQIQDALVLGSNPAIPATSVSTTTATVQLVQTGIIQEVLCNGELVSGYAVSWPSCAAYMTHPRMGSGSIQNINVAQPASATNWSVGGAYPWNGNVNIQVVNVTFSLTTSATAGNRYACIQFLTGGVSGTVVGGPFCSVYAQPASTVVTYNFSAGIGGNTNCSLIGATQTPTKCASLPVPLPLYWEANGAIDNFSVASIVLNDAATPANGFQTGDQLSAANLRVRVWHAND